MDDEQYYIELGRQELEENLVKLEEGMKELTLSIYEQPLLKIKNYAHTMKGVSGMLKFDIYFQVSSMIEKVFKSWINGQLAPNQDTIAALDDGVKFLREIIVNLEEPEKIENKKITVVLDKLTAQKSKSKEKPDTGDDKPSSLFVYKGKTCTVFADDPQDAPTQDVKSKDLSKVDNSQTNGASNSKEVEKGSGTDDRTDDGEGTIWGFFKPSEPKIVEQEITPPPRTSLLDQYCEITRERLNKLVNNLLDLEDDYANQEILNETLAELHTLKGESKIIGCNEINIISHNLEDVLKISQNTVYLREVIGLSLSALDSIGLLVDSAQEQKTINLNLEQIVKQLDDTAAQKRKDKLFFSLQSQEEEVEGKDEKKLSKRRPLKAVAKKRDYCRVDQDKLDEINNLVEDLNIKSGSFLYCLNKIRKIEEKTKYSQKLLKQVNKQIGQFDHLLDAMGGSKQHLNKEMQELEEHMKWINSAIRAIITENDESFVYLDLNLKGLYKNVRAMKMVQISTLFDTYPRAIRDMAVETGKKIKVIISGVETELDKNVIEIIRDPMVHLIRNSVDHGIESPADRTKNGKDERGNIHISAHQMGNDIQITINDDGAGIDAEKVLAKAIQKKVISRDQADLLSQAEIYNLLFKSGFSTLDTVSELSGRGVGLDSVITSLNKCDGKIEISSRPNEGSEFKLTIPITMSVFKALPVKVGEDIFFIPSVLVNEVAVVPDDSIEIVDRVRVNRWRDQVVPIVKLGEVLGTAAASKNGRKQSNLLFIRHQERYLALEVDQFLEEMSILYRSMGTFLVNLPLIAGCTIMDNGQVALILNISALLEEIEAKTVEYKYKVEEGGDIGKKEERKKRILIVDDSPIIRETQKGILISAGYEVDEAENGVQALIKLQKRSFELALVDILMPQMDGFELIQRMKEEKKFQDIPVVIMTCRKSEEDKMRGIELGCDAYLVKSDFAPDILLKTIQRHIK